jgi:hypothetical protein
MPEPTPAEPHDSGRCPPTGPRCLPRWVHASRDTDGPRPCSGSRSGDRRRGGDRRRCVPQERRLGPPITSACLTVLALTGGFGVGLYAAGFLWARRTSGTTDDAGRPAPAGPEPRREVRPGGEFGAWAFTIGLISELRNWWPGVDVRLLIPATLVAIGTSIGWRAPGDSGERRAGALLGRLLGGSMLVVVGLGVFASQRVALSTLRDASLAVLVASAARAGRRTRSGAPRALHHCRARRACPPGGTCRCRGTSARLGPANPHAHPAPSRRPRGGRHACPPTGTRSPSVALRRSNGGAWRP